MSDRSASGRSARPSYSAWNPGLESEIPTRLLPNVTLFLKENALVDYKEAKELSDFTGLGTLELIALRPERLITHELLVRVTSDLSVPDGPAYEELGINLRSMVATIYERHVNPQMSRLVGSFHEEMYVAGAYIDAQLDAEIYSSAPKKINRETNRKTSRATTNTRRFSFLARMFGSGKTPESTVDVELPEVRALAQWKNLSTESSCEKACLTALIKIVGGVVAHRGRLVADRDLVRKLVLNHIGNSYGSEVISKLLDPIIESAVVEEEYRILPLQEKPVIMNVKGASASGKSTVRPRQRRLAEKLGIPWHDFAVVSPDYWRKYLLEYDSLGEDSKYGAMLTGQELEIVDKKLDRYMAAKAAIGPISHLLIDRFRFDSFSLVDGRTSVSRLLSRFGDRVFLFFMITPPAETVERAWGRGLSTGRFKAVDDLLYHNVEAFTGMPSLFLSWVNLKDKNIHFEFLNNDVPQDTLPKTVAFGWNHTMTILDVNSLMNIDRFKRVNVNAKSPDEIFKPSDLEAKGSTGFIQQCTEKIKEVKFADAVTAKLYAEVTNGKLTWWDHEYIEAHRHDVAIVVALSTLGYRGQAFDGETPKSAESMQVKKEQSYTLGEWNTEKCMT